MTGDVFAAFRAIQDAAPAVVFNLCESIHGDNRFESLLPLLLEMEDIAYTGSSPLSLLLALHKHKAKEVLRGCGVPTPASALLTAADASAVALPFPLIVKPCREDASVGVTSGSVVRDRKTLERRVAHVLVHYRQPALVEQFVDGREIYVSILGRPRGERPQVFPFFEIDFSQLPEDRPRIVSFEAKWVEDSIEYRGTVPVRCRGLAADVEQRVGEVALAAYRALELRDYARVDIRLTQDGTPFVIDVNPNCDLSDLAGGFSKAAKAAGLSYEGLILRILELALERRRHADAIASRSRAAGGRSARRGSVASAEGVARSRAARRGARPA